ncbi:MAG: amino acid adenylation domain-containing protein [Acidobacteriota bacterium]|nr:amino acid adenylation domain-containing protein [Acidobacteriota bacterium]
MADKAETLLNSKKIRTLLMTVTANFTAEPLGDTLRFWMDRLELQPARLEFSGYNQVFQELMAPDSLLASSEPGVNFLLIRLEDWAREQKPGQQVNAISTATREFIETLKAFAQRARRPTVLLVCPPSRQASENSKKLSAVIRGLHAEIGSSVSSLGGVHLINAQDVAEWYPVEVVDDPENDGQAHIPFTPAYWTAIGTIFARKARALLSPPYKVIAVDADNTLWGGVVGEIGAGQVEISSEYLELQRLLKKQKSSGVLLALASKNEEADVAEVFQRSEMILRREDFVAWKINWAPKSQNITELAKELELGLDSFIFLDDNPVECADVQANCPAVTALQLPAAGGGRVTSFLRHSWVFDRNGATATDEKRTELYREQGERNRFKTAATSFREFIDGLNLQVSIEPPTPADYERAAQLTQRTNQFNTTGIRRLSSELGSLLESGERRMLMVSARDRFGDYGQVGLAVLIADGKKLVVENILMSCRVLGKGVEHRLMAGIGREAERMGAVTVVVPFVRTERNQPAENFLKSLEMQQLADGSFQMGAARAAAVEFNPATKAPEEIIEEGERSGPRKSSQINFFEVAMELNSVGAILSAVAGHLRHARPALANEMILPRNAPEGLIAKIWEEVLRIDHVGVTDSFLSLGGQSLQAASIASRIAGEFGVHIPLNAVLAHPTIVELNELIGRATQSGAPVSLPKAKVLTLSAAQQRLWFLDQFIPYRSAYNIPLARRINGPLDVNALEKALGEVTERHATLRSSFGAQDGAAAVQQSSAAKFFFQQVSASTEGEALKLAAEEAGKPFHLSDEPLLRALAISVGPDDQILVLNVHHIVSDGWSMGVLLKDLAEAYAAASAGHEPSWKALPVSYADYAEWQRGRLSAGDFQSDLDYWKNELRGAPALLEMPSDMPRPSVMTYAGGNIRKRISAATRGALEKLAEREHCTPFAVLLAVFQTLLHRYSQQEDIVVGVPAAGRTHGSLEEIIGCFVNTLAIRSGVDGEAPFTRHLQATRGKLLEALAHQDLPFDYLVNELGLARDLSHAPVFQAMLVLQSDIDSAFVPSGTTVRSIDVHNGGAKFDVLLEVTPAGDEYSLMLEFNKSLFVSETAERMLGHFTHLLERACASPETSLALLPMMDEKELRHTVSLTKGKESVEFATAGLLHKIIERQVAATPNAPALSFENKTLTYDELNQRANQLAHHLIKLGVGANELVGVCAERSVEMVIALLGTIKAGGAYMPLDPEYPSDRLGLMLQDAKPKAVLTQNALRNVLPQHGIPTISLDTEWSKIASEPATNPGVALKPKDAAYVIYTSGSTGIPKGVVNVHEGIVNRLLWMQDAYQLTAADRVLQKTPYSFDVSVWEFFWPLMTGAHLVVARPDGHRDPAYIGEIIVEAGITTLHFVPSMLRVFLEAVKLPKHAKLRQVFASGEALTADLQSMFFAACDAELFNLYGPTEAAVDVTHWTCRRNDPRSFVPIGYPITNIQIHILDKKLKHVPIGIPGELHIGGIGLARGYLNRPELTAERFVADPFRDEANAHLYKTGDLARFLTSGEVEYLGRIDHQVKIRGFRIELGEIESALSEHPGVRDVAVVASEDAPGAKRLVAYLVASSPAPEISALRDRLKHTLPEYMVPSIFVFLEKMPLTISGKIDRKALPAPEQQRPELGDLYAAPRTEAEKKLAAIWSRALRVEQVGINDNFFELGGDSILSIQIISAARREGLRLTPKLLFANQTIATLAAAAGTMEVEQAAGGPGAGETIAGDVPLTPIEHWFFEQNLADAHHFNQAFLFAVTEKLDRAMLEGALRELSRHHDTLRLRCERDGNSWRQRYSTDAETAPLVWKDLSGIAESSRKTEIESIAAAEQGSLNLQSGPLWRVVYFDLGAKEPGRLLFVVHHLAVDGISWRPLLEDLETAYQQLKSAQKVELPAKTASYKVWAEHLQTFSSSESLRKELPFWMATTDPVAVEYALKPLAMDAKASAANIEGNARKVKVALDRDATQALLQTIPAVYNTQINDVLLTALARAWTKWSGSNVLYTNLEGHGREHLFADVDISRTAGWFTSIFPVRLELKDAAKDWEPGETLKSVKEQLRGIPQRGVGYGILRYLSGDSELAKRSEPAMVFNYFGQFDQAVAGSKLFRFADESSGPWHAPTQKRRHALEINSLVTGGRLEFECGYNPALHVENAIQRFANEFLNALKEIIVHCQLPSSGGRTPSDFPLAKLDQSSLDQLLKGQRDAEDAYALSPIQTLFFSANHGAAQTAFDQWQCTLRGALNIAAFERAWHETVNRHTILRSTIVSAGLREPLQVVHREVRLPWITEDWRGAPPEKQTERWIATLKDDGAQPLSLTDAPAMRFKLVRLADETWKFLWSVPALLLDGWSWPLVFRDASRLYEAYAKNATPQMEAARPYRDYLEWLGQQATGDATKFWQEQLAGFRKPTALLGDAPGHEPGDEHYLQHVVQLSSDATNALQAAGRRLQVTLNTLVQGAWSLLLSRQSGDTDVVFGAAFSGRPTDLPGVESIVGPFTNNLPVRVEVNAEEYAGEFFRKVHSRLLQLSTYQFMPLMEIQRGSEVPWRYRLFDSLIVFQNYLVDDSARRLGGAVEIADFAGPIHTNYPVLLLGEPGTGLRLTLVYNRKTVARSTMERWGRDLEILLELAPVFFDQRVGELQNLLSARPAQTAQPDQIQAAQLQNFMPPQTEMEQSIASVWQKMFGLEQVNVEANFFDLGGHSLLLVQMHSLLREKLNSEFSIIALFEHPTVRALARHLGQAADSGTHKADQMRDRALRQKRALAQMRVPVKK